jgi:hypothetical protein
LKLALKRPGLSTTFADSVQDEDLLRFHWHEDGSITMSFRLYDALGTLVVDSGGAIPAVATRICASTGEVLLDIPVDPEQHISYRLYNRTGSLLTSSDGTRTHIFGFLRMGQATAPRSPTKNLSNN